LKGTPDSIGLGCQGEANITGMENVIVAIVSCNTPFHLMEEPPGAMCSTLFFSPNLMPVFPFPQMKGGSIQKKSS
jgi:hypothetical protein